MSEKIVQLSEDVALRAPKLKGISFETAIIERYRRRLYSGQSLQSKR